MKNMQPKEIPWNKETVVEKYSSCRWITVYVCFLVYAIGSMLDSCMGMVLVCMETNYRIHSNASNNSNTTSNDEAYGVNQWNIMYEGDMRRFILSADYYCLPLTPLLGGYISSRFSAKRVILALLSPVVMFSFLTPLSATLNTYFVIVLRCLVGFCMGGFQASMTVILSSWAPRHERARMVSTAFTGITVGLALGFSLSGVICRIPMNNGWPFILYIYSGCTVLILICWMCLVYDSPYEHPRITVKEINIIRHNRKDSSAAKMPTPPWWKILSSAPFYGLLCVHMTHGFNSETTGIFFPIYMNDVLKFDVTANGFLSSLPFIARIIGMFGSGFLSDMLLNRKILSVTAVRKTFQVTGNILCVPFLIGLTYMESSQGPIAVALMVCFSLITSITNSCVRVNHIDIAPRFAGVLYGISCSMAFLAALLSPFITFELAKNRTREEWQIVFFICSGLSVLSALVFLVIGSGMEQEWAKDHTRNLELNVEVLNGNAMEKEIKKSSHYMCEGHEDSYQNKNETSSTELHFFDNKGFTEYPYDTKCTDDRQDSSVLVYSTKL